MKRKTRYQIIYILCCILCCIALLDAMLYWIDPLGIVRASHAKSDLQSLIINHSTGYALQSGTYLLNYYTVTTLADGSRLVPDTNLNAGCVIAFIGDSVTWGQGVNDDETWVNILASRFLNVHFMNVARSDYSAPNIAALKRVYPANGYVWLLIENDAIAPYVYQDFELSWAYPPSSRLYFDWFFRRPKTNENRSSDIEQYWQAVSEIITDNTLVFGLDGDTLAQETSSRYTVHLIPRWTQNVSTVDTHANAEGNQEIAAAVLPFVEPFITMICNGE
jgi:hypothetical protein